MHAYIGGTIPISTTHWQGKRAMVILFAGCDFRCPFCFAAPYLDQKAESLVDLKLLEKQIAASKGLIEAMVCTGGEPLLQRQALLSVLMTAKKQGLLTSIETNGSKPQVLASLLREGLLDAVAMDIKAPFNAPFMERVTKSATYFKKPEEIIEDLHKSLWTLKHYEDHVTIEFRTTIVPGLLYRRQDLLSIAELIKGHKAIWRLRRFNHEGTLVQKRFASIRSPTKEFLNHLRDYVLQTYPQLQIEVE